MQVNNNKVSIKGNDILSGINFTLNKNEKVGLVGANGSGKSTLLKTLYGEIVPESGSINYLKESIGYLRQEIDHSFDNYSIIDYIKSETGIDKLESTLHELEQNLTDNNMDEYSDIINRYLSLDGYNFDDNLKLILNGLRFKEPLNNKIGTLSVVKKLKFYLLLYYFKIKIFYY